MWYPGLGLRTEKGLVKNLVSKVEFMVIYQSWFLGLGRIQKMGKCYTKTVIILVTSINLQLFKIKIFLKFVWLA